MQRRWGQLGGLTTSARHDAREITAPARAAFAARFYRDIPADLPQAERDRRAEAARKAHFAAMTIKSIEARRRKAGQAA